MGVAEPAVAILGLGNVLRSDDGVGPFLVEVLDSEYDFEGRASLRDLGTPGPEFVDYLLEVDVAIIVDSVSAAGSPGEIQVFDRGQILAAPPPQRLSPHDPGLREALLTAELAGRGPSQVALVGVIPASTELGTELTPAVRGALPELVEEVLRQARRFGVEPVRRRSTTPPRIWWERQGS